MTLQQLTDRIRQMAAGRPAFGQTIKLDLGNDGIIMLDGSAGPTRVDNADAAADATVRLTAETLARLLDGALSPTVAMMIGKIRVDGSIGAAMKLSAVFDD